MMRANHQSSARSVLLLDDDPAYGYLHILKSKAPRLRVVTVSNSTPDTRWDCDIWLGAPDKASELMHGGEKPAWLQLTWAGFAPLLKPSLPQNYLLTRAVDVFGQPMLEYVLAHLLAHAKASNTYLENQSRFIWSPAHCGTLLGLRVMLVGAGNIGLYIAKRLKCLGMEVVGVQRSPSAHEDLLATYDLASFKDYLDQVDVVINILPDTPDTRNIFDLDTFRRMKPGAMFMNIGRGSAVVDTDLVKVLEQQHLSAAVLDVFRQEPLPPSHQFWVAPNITITPHIAGPIDPELMVEAFLRNFEKFVMSQSLAGEVDLARGY